MLGFTALAVVPLAVAVSEVSYLSEVTENAVANNTSVAAEAIFTPTIIETTAGVDSVSVAASSFGTSIEEAAAISDETSAALLLDLFIAESCTAQESTSVAASTFNADITEGLLAVDAFLAAAVFIATVQGSATAADQVVARFLWNLIDDSQVPGWTTINDAQSTAWTVIGTDN